jgi:putative protease
MKKIVDAAKANGISALIASDWSVITYARSRGMEVHMSTQTNITNIEAVKYYAQYADVMVTARELQLEQVKAITEAIREQNITGPSGKLVQIEIFAHGALCMAVSGKCYLSLDNLNSSANRGACLQPCRRKYIVKDKESDLELEIDGEYIMSPKDLNTVSFLDKILDAGVRVLKLEGRGRSAEYVKTVAAVYREAVDSWFEGDYTQERIDDWNERLATVYNRGFWDGYYLGRKLGEWTESYGNQATVRKMYIGKVTNYFSKIGVAELKIETHDLALEDEIKIIGPTTGVYEDTISEIRLDYDPVKKAVKGDVCSIPVKELVRRGDKVYKMVPADKNIPNLVQQ